ncbi:MAG: hypothetical protein Q9227_003798 [Pyrenula ochraceoflavens]
MIVDPFLQLTITYPDKPRTFSDNSATILYANSYIKGAVMIDSVFQSDDGNTYQNITEYSDPKMVAAIESGLWSPDYRQHPSFSCSTGNCTWPPHVSLAICSHCHDISAHTNKSDAGVLTFKTTAGNITYNHSTLIGLENASPILWNPNGYIGTLHGVDAGLMAGQFSSDPQATIKFQDNQTLLFSSITIRAADSYVANQTEWEYTPITATECGLFLCSNNYSASVKNGKFSETTMSTFSKRVPTSYRPRNSSSILNKSSPYIGNDSWNPAYHGLFYVPRNDFQLQVSEDLRPSTSLSTFNVTQGAIHSMVKYLWMQANWSMPGNARVWQYNGFFDYDKTAPMWGAAWLSGSLNKTFENLAIDMSAAIRNAGNISGLSTLADEGPSAAVDATYAEASQEAMTTPLPGTSMFYVVSINVRWPFLSVLVAVCSLSILFLGGVIVQTKTMGMPLWKESELASLIWGLDGWTRAGSREIWQRKGLDHREEFKVRFRHWKGGGELSRAI